MNLYQAQVLEAIEKYLAAITKEQASDGGFVHQSGLVAPVQYKTIFFAANILACLNSAIESVPALLQQFPEIIEIRASAARFLLAQKSKHWSFNYWMRDSLEAKTMPYPDDLDDTFVALKALHGYDAGFIDGTVMAYIAKMLTALEVEPGGPYRTWLVRQGDQWRDVDLAANSNIAHFLLRLDIRLPKIEKFIEKRIRDMDLNSPYYPNVVPVIYFLSQCYLGSRRGLLIDILFAYRAANRLQCAMIVSALMNLDCSRENIVQRYGDALIDCDDQRAYPFCIDPARDGRTCYAGSAALTAAFCIEALAKLSACRENNILPQSPASPAFSRSETIVLKIKTMARARCSALPAYLRELALNEIDAISDENIVMVPYAMYEAIGRPDKVSLALLDELALANFYGWIAYTIYDDFLDDEGKPLLLSVANFFLRELGSQYAKLGEDIPELYAEYSRIMNMIDDANIREQQRVDLGGLDALADRSLGHALPALGVIFAVGHGPNSSPAKAAISFFKNYLVARQLHDDAHDWKEDLLRGRINSVALRLIEISDKSVMSGENHYGESLAELIPVLQKIFWREAISGIVADIISFLNGARTASVVFKNPVPFLHLLDQLQSVVDRTLSERNMAIQFINTYH